MINDTQQKIENVKVMSQITLDTNMKVINRKASISHVSPFNHVIPLVSDVRKSMNRRLLNVISEYRFKPFQSRCVPRLSLRAWPPQTIVRLVPFVEEFETESKSQEVNNLDER